MLAQEETRLHNQATIGVACLLLGMLHEGEGVGAQALDRLGVTKEAVTATLPPEEHAPSGHIPFTPEAKRALEMALREALQLGHNYIGTEHILLGIIRGGGETVEALALEQHVARQIVIDLLRSGPSTKRPTARLDQAAVLANAADNRFDEAVDAASTAYHVAIRLAREQYRVDLDRARLSEEES